MFAVPQNDPSAVVDLLCNQIRRDILFGILQPDHKLVIDDLTKQYGGSYFDIEKALILLSYEGLINKSNFDEFQVVKPNQGEINDIAKMRVDIECQGLEWSINNGNIHWQGLVISAQKNLLENLKLVEKDPTNYAPDLEESLKLFHKNLIAACDSQKMIDLQEELFQQGKRIRLAQFIETKMNYEIAVLTLQKLLGSILNSDTKNAKKYLSDFINLK